MPTNTLGNERVQSAVFLRYPERIDEPSQQRSDRNQNQSGKTALIEEENQRESR
jgi:hypothetical protein